jgi:1,4-alpha-glucan branching enzyme
MNDDLKRLLACRHHDPHAILGVHGSPHGAVFRCLRPDAVSVEAVSGAEAPVALRQDPDGGLWQGDLPFAQHGPSMRVRATYADGSVWDCLDPYSFLPGRGGPAPAG